MHAQPQNNFMDPEPPSDHLPTICQAPPTITILGGKGETNSPPCRSRFLNGLADNRSKVSVKKSHIGFIHINFSRSIFPYMPNMYENG